MTALTLYPGDRPEGRRMRAPAPRRRWTTRRCFATIPRRWRGAWQDAGFAWLHVVDLNGAFAGKPVNGAAVRAILARRRRSRCSSAAASATSPHRALARRRPQLRHHRHRRGQEPGLRARRLPRLPRPHHRRPRRARRQGRDRRLDARLTGHERADLAQKFEDYGVDGDRLHRHRPRRHADRRQHRRDRRRWRSVLDDPGDRLGRRRRSQDIERALRGRRRRGIEGVICGRAIYDGGSTPARRWRCVGSSIQSRKSAQHPMCARASARA